VANLLLINWAKDNKGFSCFCYFGHVLAQDGREASIVIDLTEPNRANRIAAPVFAILPTTWLLILRRCTEQWPAALLQ
jgi:hypothetical protein